MSTILALIERIPLNPFDFSVFVTYMVVTVAVGFWVARGREKKTTKGYFLGDRKLPWYVVATSMIAADISSDDLIANAGAAYKYGIVVGIGSWNAWIIYSLLIWIFLPYYVRSGIYTMPQFLERRYNATCRYIFAIALVVIYVLAILGGTLYAGGLALQGMLGMELNWAIVFFAATTGAYTIYGGLKSAAWTDFLQVCLLLTAGILIPVLGLQRVGGLGALMSEYPNKFHLFFPPTHERFPVTAVFTGFLTVGICYSCTSQHMVQRVLGAKDEWHARMGVVGAGFLRIVTPFFFVLPGIIAFKLFPALPNRDMSYLALVKELIPTGLRGLILAGMAAALMSNVSSVLNSASTVTTIDLYGKLIRPHAGERELVKFGRWSGLVILVLSMLTAFYFSRHRELSLYEQLQTVFFFISPPFAVVFTLGLLWRRANATAAVWTMGLGFLFTTFLVFYAFPRISWLHPYKTYQHPALLAWVFCMMTMIVVSLLTRPPPVEKTDGIIWNVRYADLPAELKAKYRGIRDWRIWWVLFILAIWSIFGFFAWFQFGRG